MTTSEHVRQFLVEDLEFAGDPAELSDDYDLLDSGVLDSLGIMALVEHLEATFDIVIDADDVKVEQFETIGSIATFVDAKQAA